ncbi:MAG: hypothetical protein AMXMBFR48_27910 [Ignavibacteriales bacterium]
MQTQANKNILLIDDDLTVRKLLGFHLKKRGFTAFEAGGAAQGFEFLEKEKIDLVLCDVGMDEMDGFTFCKKVRENERYRVLPFIFVTAKSSFEDKEQALEVGGDDYITKPFDVQDLIIKMQALLRRADIYREFGARKPVADTLKEDQAKILLVDDDASLAKLFQYNLKKAGFECHIANGPAAGFKIAKEVMPDIIISDVMMPEIDGFEFRRMLLNEPELKSIPFIFLTSKGGEEDILDGYDLGIADYVLKTAGPRVVVAKVSAIIKSLGKERQKVVSELHKAADNLRVKVVPDSFPVFDGYDIKHWHLPFKGVPGGDFIDYFNLDENNIAVILGDVMGKKWGAWYFAIAYAGYVRSAIRGALQDSFKFSPSKILEKVNQSVYQDSKISEVFVTLSVVLINNKDNIVTYAGAGDLPMIISSASNNTAGLVTSRGMLLGFSSEGLFEDAVINMNHGDSAILITDGLIESRNEEGLALGTDNFLKVLSDMPSGYDPMEYVSAKIKEYTGERFEDDISMITIRRK